MIIIFHTALVIIRDKFDLRIDNRRYCVFQFNGYSSLLIRKSLIWLCQVQACQRLDEVPCTPLVTIFLHRIDFMAGDSFISNLRDVQNEVD